MKPQRAVGLAAICEGLHGMSVRSPKAMPSTVPFLSPFISDAGAGGAQNRFKGSDPFVLIGQSPAVEITRELGAPRNRLY